MPTTPSPVTVAIYARISLDAAGTELGVTRQVEACEARAADQGWEVVGTYIDNSVSAYSGVERPEFERILRDAKLRKFDRILAWHNDRLARRPADLERVISLEVPVETVVAGYHDLSNPASRATARTVTAWALYESEQKAERLRLKHRQLANSGAWAGGRAFGYTKTGEVIPEEAEVIRDLVQRLLAGESLRGLTTWLNTNKVPTVRGGVWRTSTLRAILGAARLSGQREHTPRSEGRGYGFGTIVAQDANWEAIITKDETAMVRALLQEPSRRTTKQARYLLTNGILICGVCEKPLNRGLERGGPRYRCIRVPGTGKCGKISVVAEYVDKLVEQGILHTLWESMSQRRATEARAAEAAQAASAEREKQAKDYAERKEALLHSMVDGHISVAQYESALASLDERLGGSVVAPRRPRYTPPVRSREELEEWWKAATLAQRRSLAESVVKTVKVSPSTLPKGTPRFDPNRVSITWRA